MFAAMIADDFKSRRRICARRRLFRTAFRTALRLRHITLIKSFLFFFGKKKNFLALNTGQFYVRHLIFSLYGFFAEKCNTKTPQILTKLRFTFEKSGFILTKTNRNQANSNLHLSIAGMHKRKMNIHLPNVNMLLGNSNRNKRNAY